MIAITFALFPTALYCQKTALSSQSTQMDVCIRILHLSYNYIVGRIYNGPSYC